MLSSKIPSPARSQGAKSTPRRYKPRASRSVGSPAHSTSSVKLTTVIQMESLALSPLPARRSILTDNTDIDIPRRKSWWKKLDENSREIMEVLNNKDPAEANYAIEEYIEVDVLSQEKKNYTIDIPESSDGESISSIVIPQRKLFTQKESKAQKNFAQIIDNRESLAPLHRTQGESDKTINVPRKNLFSHGTKRKTKPLFPSALLNISANKTITNKTKEMVATDPNAQVKSLFGNRLGMKRKNMFADFIVSDSEDEIPEIQPKVFEFQKKAELKRRHSLNTRASRESHITTSTASITDIEIDDWRHLPSSTMVDHQLEDGLRTTPSKRTRLGKLSDATEINNTKSNATTNKTKQSNKSLHCKSKSKSVSQLDQMEVDELNDPRTTISELNAVKENNQSTIKNISRENSLKEQMLKNKAHSKFKNDSLMKIANDVACDDLEDKNAEANIRSYTKSSKSLSKIDQVLQSDDDEDFTLVYENKENAEVEKEVNRTKISIEIGGSEKNNADINEEEIEDNHEAENEDNEKSDKQDEDEKSENHDIEVEQEIIKTGNDKKLLVEEVIQNKKTNSNVEKKPRDEVDNEIFNYKNKDISNNQDHFDKNNRTNVFVVTPKNKEPNVTRICTSRHEQNDDANIASPEIILHDQQSQIESFTVQGRNTSVRKTKSIIKNFTIRQSLAPVTESTNFSNGSRNSSAEGSGWDSHRATRATLRQTFGKDFTPRKSLHSLVMKKSAKRQTNYAENNTEISRLPQANSTELPESTPFAMNESNDEAAQNMSEDNVINNILDNPDNVQIENKSTLDVSRILHISDESKEIPETNQVSSLYDENGPENSKIDEAREMEDSNLEVTSDIEKSDEDNKNNESDQEDEINESDDNHEVDGSGQAVMREVDESDNESDQAAKSNESDNGHDINEFNNAVSREIDDDDNSAQVNDEYEKGQETYESDDGHEMEDSGQSMSRDMDDPDNNEEMYEANNSQEINQSGHKVFGENHDADEESKMDVEQELDESEMNESEDAQNINESDDEGDVNETENPHEMHDSEHELSIDKDHEDEVHEVEYGHDASRKTRQTTLEMYLQKIKKQNIERKKQLEEEIRNSLKAPTRDMLNPFKVPAVPKLRHIKTQKIKTKEKPVKSSVIPMNMLPVEMLEDMKYKPPKRYRPTSASWITKRLYKFLENKLEPKYDYKARVRSEKLVETIYKFTRDIRRHDTARPAAVLALKHEMARLNVVKTHFEFYEFFHEYMPREVRVKVVPDVFNKISLPKYGVFSDILR